MTDLKNILGATYRLALGAGFLWLAVALAGMPVDGAIENTIDCVRYAADTNCRSQVDAPTVGLQSLLLAAVPLWIAAYHGRLVKEHLQAVRQH
jgi:hypothetical protein